MFTRSKLSIIFVTLFLYFYLFIFTLQGDLTPEHVQQHIKRLIAQKYQLYVVHLGNTVNNNSLKAYVITGIKKGQSEINQITPYPATLITSYMHPREPYSLQLIQKVLDQVLNNYETDYYLKYMLDNSLLILFPFVNIDGYYRYQQMLQNKTSIDILEKYRKNMNKGNEKCRHQWDFGVDINRNFDSSFGTIKTSDNQCGQQYRGPQPFSQKQAKAIKMLYKKFKITIAIDIHSYGNQWIYPYASEKTNQKFQSHRLYPIYQDLFQQFKAIGRPMKSCFESLGYVADGVYIDWALDKGALSFAFQVGKNFNGDINIGSQIIFETQQAFHKIFRKNSISYKFYLTKNNQFVVQSTSMLDFQIQFIVNDKPSQHRTLQSLGILKYKIQPGTTKAVLKIQNTIIEEQILFSQLKVVDQIPKLVGGNLSQDDGKISPYSILIVASIVVIVLGLIIILVLNYLKNRKDSYQRSRFSLPKDSQQQM